MSRFRIVNGDINDLLNLGLLGRDRSGRFVKGAPAGKAPNPVPSPEALPTASDFAGSADLHACYSLVPHHPRRLAAARSRESTRWASLNGPLSVYLNTRDHDHDRLPTPPGARPGTGTAWLCRCSAEKIRFETPTPCPQHGDRYQGCNCGGYLRGGSGYQYCAGHRVTVINRNGDRRATRSRLGWVNGKPVIQGLRSGIEHVKRPPYLPPEDDCRTWG